MDDTKTLHDDAIMTGAATMPLAGARLAVSQAMETGTAPFGLPAALLRERGTLKLYYYEPRGADRQPVHDQDEVYVVVSGSGTFAIGACEDSLRRERFEPGDAILTPAGALHRFEDFTDDFGVWVIMYGRAGGEQPDDACSGSAPADPVGNAPSRAS